MRNWKCLIGVPVAEMVILAVVGCWILVAFGGDAVKDFAIVVLALKVALLSYMVRYPKSFARRFPCWHRLVTTDDG